MMTRQEEFRTSILPQQQLFSILFFHFAVDKSSVNEDIGRKLCASSNFKIYLQMVGQKSSALSNSRGIVYQQDNV